MSIQQEERGWYLAQDKCEQVIRTIRAMANGGGRTDVEISSWWNGELRWARNRVDLGSDRCDVNVVVRRQLNGGQGGASTNQLDDVSLEAVMRCAERRTQEKEKLRFKNEVYLPTLRSPALSEPQTRIWSDSTYAVTAETRSSIARLLTEESETEGMLSAGYLEVRAASKAVSLEHVQDEQRVVGTTRFHRLTQAQCSMTVRHPKGTGSGWAGLSSFDYDAVDGLMLAKTALHKCLTSIDPVMIEPGRYTVILEPQAVCQLLEVLMDGALLNDDSVESPLSRKANEKQGSAPFLLGYDSALMRWRSKLGLPIIDDRLTIDHDPLDASLGVVPREGLGTITWIKNGVLNSLHHSNEYARKQLHRLSGELFRPSFRVSGGTTPIDEMIATTKRGLLVTRFSHIENIDFSSLLSTGITRDGLWLIENGKISKAVKNMRFTESPLFSLNQVEQLGMPVPVFRPVEEPAMFNITPAIVPSMKIRDFSFTALVDAV